MKRIKFAFQAGHSRSYYVDDSELVGVDFDKDNFFDITNVDGRRVIVYKPLARVEVWDEEQPPPV